jgi:RNA polymerase sigma factor (sigma-70 family)
VTDEQLTAEFKEQRPHLRAVAYRMLGSVSEADEAVQEAWLRASRANTSDVEDMCAWLTTVVARVSLNMLRSRRSKREEPLGVHVPEPIVSSEDGLQPEHEALLADSVGLALLVVLETLNPAERLAYVLIDMFAMPFDDIAPIVERSPAATRQLASRARRRVEGEAAVPDPDLGSQRVVVGAFMAARVRATSRGWSRSSIRTSTCAPTWRSASPGTCAAPRRWRARRGCTTRWIASRGRRS